MAVTPTAMVAGTCSARVSRSALVSCARPHLDPRRPWGVRTWPGCCQRIGRAWWPGPRGPIGERDGHRADTAAGRRPGLEWAWPARSRWARGCAKRPAARSCPGDPLQRDTCARAKLPRL